MNVPKRCRTMTWLKPTDCEDDETTLLCAVCEASFTGKCGRDALVLLIKHLRENVKHSQHRVESDWMKNQVLRRDIDGRNGLRSFLARRL